MMKYNDVARIIAENRGITLVEMVVINYLRPGFMGSVVQQIDLAITLKPVYQTMHTLELNRVLDSIAIKTVEPKIRPFEGDESYGDMVFGWVRVAEDVGARITKHTLDVKEPSSGPRLIPDRFDSTCLVQEERTTLTRDINLFLFPSLTVAWHVKRKTGSYSNCPSLGMDIIRQLMCSSAGQHPASELTATMA